MFNLRERPQPETEIDHETRLPGVGVIGKHDGIRAIRIPRRALEFEWFCKVGACSAQAIARVGVAIVKDASGWHVVAHSVAPAVCRYPMLEAALDAGSSFASPEEVADVLQADISPIDDLRSTAKYRARVLSRIIYFALDEREKRKEKREK